MQWPAGTNCCGLDTLVSRWDGAKSYVVKPFKHGDAVHAVMSTWSVFPDIAFDFRVCTSTVVLTDRFRNIPTPPPAADPSQDGRRSRSR